MPKSRYPAIVAAIGVFVALGAATLLTARHGQAAAQQSTPACSCAAVTSVPTIGTNLVHCQCGPATCVVSEHFTGQSKTYSLQCTK
jgi:hypothetical protein